MNSELTNIKSSLESQIGNNLVIKMKSRRIPDFRNETERKGILAGIYPRVFVIEFEQTEYRNKRMSFSYVDILTSSVELSFFVFR